MCIMLFVVYQTSYDILFIYWFFFKQKTAYEMRISDWSSDVCSAELNAWLGRRDTDRSVGRRCGLCRRIRACRRARHRERAAASARCARQGAWRRPDQISGEAYRLWLWLWLWLWTQIGRAACRERVCQYV